VTKHCWTYDTINKLLSTSTEQIFFSPVDRALQIVMGCIGTVRTIYRVRFTNIRQLLCALRRTNVCTYLTRVKKHNASVCAPGDCGVRYHINATTTQRHARVALGVPRNCFRGEGGEINFKKNEDFFFFYTFYTYVLFIRYSFSSNIRCTIRQNSPIIVKDGFLPYIIYIRYILK
jgi:hypothetical protein